jgi:peptidoglycan L-alanyl-D-glutamate endopeptidase CwlK
MSRNLVDLHSEVRWRAEKLKEACVAALTPILIYSTLRTFKEQEVLYAHGRTKPGQVVTNARPGESFHNYGLAFDAIPILESGKPDWENREKIRILGELGESIGLQWGGRWPTFKDYPHFQMAFGFDCKQLLVFYDNGGVQKVWDVIDRKVEEKAWP